MQTAVANENVTRTRAQTLRAALEEDIATGRYPPGTRLDEAELAARFNVSRTPIREALIQLASAGVLELRPRRGAVVPEVTPQRLVEMFEVMSELEALCGRMAARRMSPEELVELEAAHQACETARQNSDPDDYYYKNEAFHNAIYAGSHNGFLFEQAVLLHRRLGTYRRLQLRVRDRMAASFSEHQAVVDAIKQGNEELTASLLRDHVVIQGQRFADLMASLQRLR